MGEIVSGKSINSIMAGMKNDIQDHIRYETTAKRDIRKLVHAGDLRSRDDGGEEDERSDDEILSSEQEKHLSSENQVVELVEAKENWTSWMATLSEKEKIAVKFKMAEDSEAQIAQKMGISQQRVSQLISQARKKRQKIIR